MSDIIDLEPYDNEPAELEVSEVFVDAVSPRVLTEAIEGGHRVTVTDVDGSKSFDVMDGERGLPGLNGRDGLDGETPLMTASKTGTTTTVTFTTSKDRLSFDIEDGEAGAPGQKGFSPQATVTKTGDTATIRIEDLSGVTTATVSDGATGAQGEPGQDGVSPTITVTDITGGHRVTITDATGAHSFDVMDGEAGAGSVTDVQVNGVSVLSEGVANVPMASATTFGTVRVNSGFGIKVISSGGNAGTLSLTTANDSQVKQSIGTLSPIPSAKTYMAAFYGLAKAAGDTTQSQSSNAVGTYTESAKSAISEMLGGAVEISGTTPSITGMAGVRYVCGECATLDVIAPATGCIDVIFTSGSTATVLTVTSAKANTTIKWANGFDPSSLDADTVYEINILDGELGVAMAWT